MSSSHTSKAQSTHTPSCCSHRPSQSQLRRPKAGLTLDQIDVFEIHEAFSAQVLATLACLESEEFAKDWLPAEYGGKAVGTIPREKINPNGSSIAIGHPFAATGGRIVGSLANTLRRTGQRYGLISICAAGGMGGVMILENVNHGN